MKVRVCAWNICKSNFSEYIFERLENDKQKFGMENLEIEKSPCMGNCKKSVNISIWSEIFSNQNPIKSSTLINKKYENENK